jgi:hypothetical protein
MNILTRVFRKLFLVKEIVSKAGVVHFRRWRIIQTPLFAVYFHNVIKSDADKDPHDHPWAFISFILSGSYYETRVQKDGSRQVCLRCPGNLFSCRTNEFHRLKVVEPTWTFVITGPRTHGLWGYLTEDGWVDHITYRKRKNGEINAV